ncbi:MAG: hypothetical protein WB471_00320 [Nocardioides sp.]
MPDSVEAAELAQTPSRAPQYDQDDDQHDDQYGDQYDDQYDETQHAQQQDPHTPPHPPQHPRAGASAWTMSAGWAGLTVVVLAPFAIAAHPERSISASLAAVVVPALLVAAGCGLIAARSASGWSWWLYPPIVILPTIALVLLTDLVPDRMENVRQAGDSGERRLTAPAQSGPWALQSGAGADNQEAVLRDRILRADESLEAVYGLYRGTADDILVYNGINVTVDSDLARELVARPQDALRDYLDGTGITDVVDVAPGDLSGAMACGTVPRLGPYVDLIVCGWADSGGIGTATYRVDGINPESAAETTRQFRADVTVVG